MPDLIEYHAESLSEMFDNVQSPLEKFKAKHIWNNPGVLGHQREREFNPEHGNKNNLYDDRYEVWRMLQKFGKTISVLNPADGSLGNLWRSVIIFQQTSDC